MRVDVVVTVCSGIQHLRYLRTEDGMVQENGNVRRNSVHPLTEESCPLTNLPMYVVNFPSKGHFSGQ